MYDFTLILDLCLTVSSSCFLTTGCQLFSANRHIDDSEVSKQNRLYDSSLYIWGM